MAGDPYDDPTLKGMSRYFNNKTIKGRANVSLATLVFLTVGYIAFKLKPLGQHEMPTTPLPKADTVIKNSD